MDKNAFKYDQKLAGSKNSISYYYVKTARINTGRCFLFIFKLKHWNVRGYLHLKTLGHVIFQCFFFPIKKNLHPSQYHEHKFSFHSVRLKKSLNKRMRPKYSGCPLGARFTKVDLCSILTGPVENYPTSTKFGVQSCYYMTRSLNTCCPSERRAVHCFYGDKANALHVWYVGFMFMWYVPLPDCFLERLCSLTLVWIPAHHIVFNWCCWKGLWWRLVWKIQ